MNEALELLRDYYETSTRLRDVRWAYKCTPLRSKKDKERSYKLFCESSDLSDKLGALEETIESFIMTRTPNAGR